MGAGAVLIGAGVIANYRASHDNGMSHSERNDANTRRNIYYGVGGALLVGGLVWTFAF